MKTPTSQATNSLSNLLFFKDVLALAKWLSWLELRPDTAGLRTRSPVRAHAEATSECVNKWKDKWMSLPHFLKLIFLKIF